MSRILLDTNAYSSFMAGNKQVLDYMIESDIIYISTVMLGELFAGFYGGSRISHNLSELKIFLDKESVQVLDVTIESAEIFGEIKSKLSKSGKMLPLNDIWIAAHAMESGSKLVTYDRHYCCVDGLRIWELLCRPEL